MRSRLATVVVVVAALGLWTWLPSSGPARGVEPPPVSRPVTAIAEADPVLIPGPAGSLVAVDPATDRVLYRAAHARTSPGGERVYSTRGRWIDVLDASDGRRLASVRRPAGMQLQVTSDGGEILAFAAEPPEGATPWIPGGRATTRLKIAPVGDGRTRTYDLKGNFIVEAFAADGREVYLIEFMPARSPWHYGLRRLVLRSGAVREIARDKQGAPGEMNGTGKLGVFSPAGDELYTLYTQQGGNYTHVAPDEADDRQVYAFVHQLNLTDGWTHCIDLPAPFGTGRATAHAMAVSPDGTRLYVADPSSGGLAMIDPQTSRVLKTVTTDLDALTPGAAATVSADGVLYLAGRTHILAFDAATLELLRTIGVPSGSPSIAVDPDGERLYLVRAGDAMAIDAKTGTMLSRQRLGR